MDESTELLNPTQALNSGEIQNPTQEDLDNVLAKLGQLEKQIFTESDGKINGENRDTIIDDEYEKGLSKAASIKAKVDLVKALITTFAEYLDDPVKNISKYTDEKGKQNLNKISEMTKDLILKYPKYEESILLYTKNNFLFINDKVNYFENYYKNSEDSQLLNVNKQLIQGNLDMLISTLGDLEKSIKYIEDSDFKDKEKILKYSVDNNLIINLPKHIKDIKESKFFTDSKNIIELDLIKLSSIFPTDLENLDNLYKNYLKDNKKVGELVDFIDNLDPSQKTLILNMANLKKIYADEKIFKSCLNPEFVSKDIIIQLSNIKDKNLELKLEGIALDNSGEKFKHFVDNELNVILKTINISDKYYLLEFLDYFTMSLDENRFIGYKVKIQNFTNENTNNLEKSLEIQVNKLLVDPNTTPETKARVRQLLTNPIKDNIPLYLSTLSGSVINKPNPIDLLKPGGKQKEMQKQISELGLNAKINEKGGLEGLNGEKNFKQTIGNRNFEVNEDGEIFVQGALGYNFKYDNNENGINKFLEIADKIEYIDKLGFGYFGNNFKRMVNILNSHTNLTGLGQIKIDDGKMNSTTFLNNDFDLNILTTAFYKLGFLEKPNYSYWFNEGTMSKTSFNNIMKTKFEGKNFLIGGGFDEKIFISNLEESFKNK
ncbi:MAG: hypothetical protein PHE25_01100 [Candidatus Gracilibacteria bacterium]|nr:hypothetical protein [Candidatus Gracilibacteria bacterium]